MAHWVAVGVVVGNLVVVVVVGNNTGVGIVGTETAARAYRTLPAALNLDRIRKTWGVGLQFQ